MVSFNTIPTGIRTSGAYIEFDASQAQKGTPAQPNRIIVLGQRLTGGAVAAGIPTLMQSTIDGQNAFGRGSMLAIAIAALKKANPITECWAIAQDDNGAGVAATGSDTFVGTPTLSSTFSRYIDGNLVQASFTAGMTAAQMATAWVAAIAANPDLPLTAAVDGTTPAKVNYTANHKGLSGNDIDLRTTYYPGDALPAGVTVTSVPMTGGTTSPVLTASITALGDSWFNHWLNPYTDATSMAAITAELDRRFGPTVQREGHSYSAARGTVSTLGTLGLSYNTLEPSIMDAGNMPTHPIVVAAVLTGVCAFRLGNNPSPALSGIPLPGVLPPAKGSRRNFADRQVLLYDGISTYNIDDGGNVVIDRVISMYRQNAAGAADNAYLNVERLFQLFRWRYLMRLRMVTKYANYDIASDATKVAPGVPTVQPKTYKLELIGLARENEGTLVQNVDDFAAKLVVEVDANNPGQMNSLQNPDFVDQLFVHAARVQFTA